MSSAAMPALRNIIRAATYAQLCCMQHIWAHVRRDFIKCAAGNEALAEWERRWTGRIALLYRLNGARLEHYDAGLGPDGQNRAFAAAHRELERALGQLFAAARRELDGLPDDAREGKPPRSLLNHREGLSVFLDRRTFPWTTIFPSACSGGRPSADVSPSAPTARPVARQSGCEARDNQNAKVSRLSPMMTRWWGTWQGVFTAPSDVGWLAPHGLSSGFSRVAEASCVRSATSVFAGVAREAARPRPRLVCNAVRRR